MAMLFSTFIFIFPFITLHVTGSTTTTTTTMPPSTSSYSKSDPSPTVPYRMPALHKLLNVSRARASRPLDGPKPAHLASPAEILKRIVELRCNRADFSVLLHVDNRLGLLTVEMESALAVATMSLAGAWPNNTDHCPDTVFQREPGLRRLLGSYDNVCVDQIVQTNVTIYQFQVAFQFHSNRTNLLPKQTLTLQCLIPPDEANLAVQHQMTMAGGHVDIRLWPSQREVPVDSTLFIQAQPVSSWYRGSNLRSYPLNCWVNSNASESVPRIYFVKHGCPAISMLGRGLSRMLHSPTSSPKIGLDLSRIIMSELGIEVNETLSLHCEYFPCTAISTESLLFTPKCPPFYSCAGDRTETPIAIALSMLEPSPPQSAYLTVVPKQRAELGDVDCFLLCPDAGSAQSSIAEEQDNTAFSAYAAIVLTLASFVTGMGMTAFLWCYYRRHNKRQIVRNAQQQQQQQQREDEQAQPTPLIAQEHTYEFAQTDDHN
ncbi:Leukocyte-associated immunoglobulin-like receptor [Trichinella pseudospiralis]